ncbi:serine dehydrogenase ase family protein [Clostridium botulinum]|uniref:head maturation protease, ClpP-related n=1 Tax=Clostridium botulinum TaxID=1491 RepID=UPI0010003AB2|nr:head maturation protease, ClpP-related [Clostridium botulinum]RUT55184.1 serine dehydrogenase ase family protein [Clostridium botulinum]
MKIEVKGTIVSNEDALVYKWFDMDCICPKDVNNLIKQCENNEDLEVEINSGGGSVFAGSEIYTALKGYKGNVTIKIVGLAASAASVIAMAGNKILMSPTAQMMIHNASASVGGDYRDMEHSAGVLKNINTSIANAYKLKTGMDQEELLTLMDSETWLTPQQALEKQFIDEVMFENEEFKATASFSNTLLPQEVINKVRNELKKEPVVYENEGNNESVENKKREIEIFLNLI